MTIYKKTKGCHLFRLLTFQTVVNSLEFNILFEPTDLEVDFSDHNKDRILYKLLCSVELKFDLFLYYTAWIC